MTSSHSSAGSRSRQPRQDHRDRHEHRRMHGQYDPRGFEIRSASSFVSEPLQDEEGSERFDYGRPKRTSRLRQTDLGFEAVHNLEQCLAQAAAELGDLAQDFNDEIEPITNYAGQDVLDELWKRKVKSFAREQAVSSHDRSGSRSLMTTADTLEIAIEDVLTCAHGLRRRGPKGVSSRSSDSVNDGKLRLAGKLEIGRGDLIGSLRRAPKYQNALKVFLTEAQLLQTIIRTVSQAWRPRLESSSASSRVSYEPEECEPSRSPPHHPPPGQSDNW